MWFGRCGWHQHHRLLLYSEVIQKLLEILGISEFLDSKWSRWSLHLLHEGYLLFHLVVGFGSELLVRDQCCFFKGILVVGNKFGVADAAWAGRLMKFLLCNVWFLLNSGHLVNTHIAHWTFIISLNTRQWSLGSPKLANQTRPITYINSCSLRKLNRRSTPNNYSLSIYWFISLLENLKCFPSRLNQRLLLTFFLFFLFLLFLRLFLPFLKLIPCCEILPSFSWGFEKMRVLVFCFGVGVYENIPT